MKKFKLHSCCMPVKGAKVSIICDFQRFQYFYITNDLFNILHNDLEINYRQIIKKYSKFEQIVKEYFDFLIVNELGFFYDPKIDGEFPKISENFNTPDLINNALIDLKKFSNFKVKPILEELETLGCKYLSFRIFDSISSKKLLKIVSDVYNTKFLSVEIILNYNTFLKLYKSVDLLINTNINSIIVYNTPDTKIKEYDSLEKEIFFFSTENIINENCCGKIIKQNFNLNLDHYLEGLKSNTCLNKKISINSDGFICNCPTISKNYGHVSKHTLHSVMKEIEFKKLWEINKDNINVCKDCQFRYICTDCRAFVDNIYDKPKKCNYDPYENKWN